MWAGASLLAVGALYAGRRWPLWAGASLLLKAVLALALMSSALTPSPGAWAWSAACLAALLALTLLLPGRAVGPACWALAALASAVLWGDVLYYRGFGDFPTVGQLAYLSRAEHQGPQNNVETQLSRLARPADVWFGLDLVLVLPALLLSSRVPRRRLPWLAVSTLFVAGNVVWLWWAAPLSGNVMRTRQYNWVHVKQHGLIVYHVYDLYFWIRPRLAPPVEVPPEVIERRLALSRATIGPQHPHFGAARGCNVLMMQLESFQYFLLGRTVEGQEVTPFLNRLRQESLYADALDQTSQGSTSDCQFLLLNSLHPPGTGVFCFDYPRVATRALPRLLGEQGWSTLHVMPYDGAFWNTRVMCEQFGFERQLFSEDLPRARRGENVGWGLSDAALLERLLPLLQEQRQPWFAYVTTTMMHFPFEELRPHQCLLALPPHLQGTMAGRYLQLARFRDSALQLLAGRLQEQGLWDKTVLVMAGDHRSRLPSAELARLGVQGPEPVRNRVPLFFHLPGGAVRGDLPPQCGQLDVAPTLLHLLGLADARPVFLGRNALAGPHASACVYGYVTDGTRAVWADATDNADLRLQLEEETRISDWLVQGDRLRRAAKSAAEP